MSAVNDLTEGLMRELAEQRAEQETFLSLYLDLDPSTFATGAPRASEIDSLLDQAHREIEGGERPHAERQALRAALERARQTLTLDSSWADGARAVALFVCEPQGVARLLRLPHPVASAAVVSDAPFIAPLAEEGPAGRVCVALVDERFARILRGSGDSLHEVISFGDTVPGRHDQGGWSQARYQRSRQADVDAHLRHVARTLQQLLKVAPFQRLLVACAQPLWQRLLDKLHPDVRALLDERRLSLDVGVAGIEDVVTAACQALAEEQREHEDALLERLRELQGRAAAGLPAVLDALVQRRVQALIYDAALQAPGVLCPRCGWMGAEGDSCPVDGGPLEQRDSILADALRAALVQSAEVLPLRDRPELGPFGGIAAALRF